LSFFLQDVNFANRPFFFLSSGVALAMGGREEATPDASGTGETARERNERSKGC
jgi:hypothetical protein